MRSFFACLMLVGLVLFGSKDASAAGFTSLQNIAQETAVEKVHGWRHGYAYRYHVYPLRTYRYLYPVPRFYARPYRHHYHHRHFRHRRW